MRHAETVEVRMAKIVKGRAKPFGTITTIEGRRQAVSDAGTYSSQRDRLLSVDSRVGKTRSGSPAKAG